MKRCLDCGKYKRLDQFPRNKRMRDGRHPYCKPCHNGRGRESKDRLYRGDRHYHLKRRYGIGAADFNRLVRDQRGLCPICGKPNPEHVDHDHKTGRVRGILCFNCNGGLGQFGDDTERLVRAQLYLESSEVTPEERTLWGDLADKRARLCGGGRRRLGAWPDGSSVEVSAKERRRDGGSRRFPWARHRRISPHQPCSRAWTTSARCASCGVASGSGDSSGAFADNSPV